MMETRLHQKQEELSAGTPPPENGVESPLSGDEAAEVSTPSPRKRRGAQKRVVSMPAGDGDGSRSKSEVYPPPDSWSWRKYGQKPIKGSPYPRGYYRCSSSKGCPARKQVERSRLDPTMLLITYSSDHNHPLPTKTHHHYAAAAAATTTTSAATTPTDSAADHPGSPKPELAIFADPDPENNSFPELAAGEMGWFSDVGSCCFMESAAFAAGPTVCHDTDVALTLPIREEDQSLFGDLGELPECSVVFRRCRVETPCFAGTG
ncbi:PREDICTED: probable WRKY transcription factor 69 [Ipomoea nil]|uniref:probable WRKY transcription factor 69 n=1 Tax=Ipomoea nil TaxID=35883 RepID=UPI000900E3C9|nr:PREDICTED: probable WRKY transcription factor 69 [Ipomoea nil]